MIALWSKSSVASAWVRNEARVGSRRSVLVPLHLDGASIPFEFDHLQSADLSDWVPGITHAEFDKVLNEVEAVGWNASPGAFVPFSERRPPSIRCPTSNESAPAPAGPDCFEPEVARAPASKPEANRRSFKPYLIGAAIVVAVLALVAAVSGWPGIRRDNGAPLVTAKAPSQTDGLKVTLRRGQSGIELTNNERSFIHTCEMVLAI